MFRAVEFPQGRTIMVTVDGKQLSVPEGATVAAALLGHTADDRCRCSFVSAEPRTPFCFIGVCHECLVEIDAVPNQQACLTIVREGMKINRQQIHEGA